ncbi:MAG: MBL fold metallo-hydrolase [Anaerolineales bacterium]
MSVQISFHGAAQTVTGSQFLLEVNGRRLLLECGLFQGRRAEAYERNRRFPFDPRRVDAVLLSHAHIDHSGNLPNLVRQGFDGPIYATPATVDLANVMLRDSAHIQESDIEYLRRKRGQDHLEPLYTLEDVLDVMPLFRPVPYDRPFEPLPGVVAEFVEAGHMLGSAAIRLEVQEGRRKVRIWFSGDIGRPKLPLLRDPVLPSPSDYLIMECTYGHKPHRDPQAAYEELREALLRTLERGGKVIVPAFAVGRTQELVYDIHQMVEKKEIPPVPVYVDSPLAVDASAVFRQHTECFDEETRRFVLESRHPALDFEHLHYVRSVEESKKLNDRREPMIIISASGMAETGRILHHLRNNIGDPRNTILIVSWQAPHTLGRRLADREPQVRIFGETYDVRAEVVTIGGLSAHAGQDFLIPYALAAQAKKIFLVHGEAEAADALREKLLEHGAQDVFYPERGEKVALEF